MEEHKAGYNAFFEGVSLQVMMTKSIAWQNGWREAWQDWQLRRSWDEIIADEWQRVEAA